MSAKHKTVTLGELKALLRWMADLGDDTEIVIGNGDLTVLRAKTRLYKPDNKTPAQVQIELGQLYTITFDPSKDA